MHANALHPTDLRLRHQERLEELYDKHQLLPRIREAFWTERTLDFKGYMMAHGFPVEFGIDLLAQMAVHKRCPPATLIGCLRHHLNSSRKTAELIERAVELDLVDYHVRDQQLVIRYGIDDALQRELDKFQYPLPMVVPPATVESNRDTGYLTGRGSLILRDNHHDDDICLDHINRINRTCLAVDLDTALAIHNRWRGLDKKKADESWEDFKKRKRAFEKYDAVAKDVIALLIREGNELYLTHKYDKRGRTYCMGFHVTYQGTDWNKAVLEFAHKEPIED